MLQKLLSKRSAQEKWERDLVWFRLRYLQADDVHHCLNLLSRSDACGRVALYFQAEQDISRLYLGVPHAQRRLLQQMVTDFAFSLKKADLALSIPPPQKMIPTANLPWQQSFMAHIVQQCAYVCLLETAHKKGSYFPQGTDGAHPLAWTLPQPPPPGLTLRPFWPTDTAAHELAIPSDDRSWPLGRTETDLPLYVSGMVNLYGRQTALVDWLVPQIVQMIKVNPTKLLVIDGQGDLVPQLKRKTAVTRLLGEQLSYIDIDGAALATGFNPLALLPGESPARQLERWQRWFQGMAVHPQGISLLAEAQQAGVTDLPTLRQWLKQKERQGAYTAVSSLRMVLQRLRANRALREWLDWPTNPFAILPTGALLFACKSSSWARQQLLQAVLLSAVQIENIRFIVHGFPWIKTAHASLCTQQTVLMSNAPLLPESTVVLTETDGEGGRLLATRFLANDVRLREHLALLQRGEGLIVHHGKVNFTTWNR
mgnify:CR=1 FL=1